ncbi:M48 family metalloprotease [Pseudomonas aeruginosa]|uniref:M48 family metallopeptidase n=1 Tax=Pseudomonas aeruginosa TaxID=287 RepID=UPI0023405987|nr:M48 family metallopeptidase [Pseudomonas aeruginosa]MDC3950164.1 M48 family metalloprotease [Pseudomonas aeruginosa]
MHAGLLVAALASQLLYEALWSYSHWHSHGFVALLFSLPLWLLFLGGLLMLRRLRGELLPLEEPVLHLLGRELDRVAAPGLWQWLGQIADRAGAPLPDHVVTGIEHCYFVTQAKILLAPRGIPLEGRTLYIPLTYATVMSEAESAAIIGHELGHFAAGDTAHGASLSLLQRQVRLRIERIAAPEDGRVGLLGKPGLWAALYFLDRFERAYLHWNRRQELAADKVGARVAGARVFAIALLRTCALAGLIERLLASPQTRNLVHALTDHLRGHSLELDEQDSARRLEHPFDSHPPTYQRIADLSLALDDDLLRQARRIVSADDTQWLNRLLDAGHGESR